jgi:hypothetical protein
LSSGDLEFGRGTPGGVGAQPAIQTDAERVAAGITEGAPEPVRVAFGLTHLPAGMRIVGISGATADGYGTIDVMSGSQKVLRTAEAGTEDGIGIDEPRLDETGRFSVFFQPGALLSRSDEDRIDDIQGKPAYLLNQGGMVAVEWSPQGWAGVSQFVADAGSRPLTPEEFRAVAAGIRWTG